MANRPAMKTALWVDPRHKVWRGALLVALPLLLIIVPEVWAQNGPLLTPSPRLIAGTQTEGAQTARTPFRPLGNQIEDALAKGNPDTARMLVPRFLAEPNVTADTLLRTGVSLAQHELFQEATDVFARCVKDHPAMFAGYYNLALAELALRKYPVALATYDQRLVYRQKSIPLGNQGITRSSGDGHRPGETASMFKFDLGLN